MHHVVGELASSPKRGPVTLQPEDRLSAAVNKQQIADQGPKAIEGRDEGGDCAHETVPPAAVYQASNVAMGRSG